VIRDYRCGIKLMKEWRCKTSSLQDESSGMEDVGCLTEIYTSTEAAVK
jgi:hypothetical protein